MERHYSRKELRSNVPLKKYFKKKKKDNIRPTYLSIRVKEST